MDQVIDRQALVDRQRADMVARYPSIWNKIIAEWNSPGSDGRAWLMYSANYLFRTGAVRWAIDPLQLKSRVSQVPAMQIARDLKDLDFVLLTHRHRDHLDLGLLNSLKHFPICWVVPEAILPLVKEQVNLPARQILVPKPLQLIDLHGIHITPFNGLHWEENPGSPDGRRGVPAMGYLVEQDGKRWLFPGDTRTYDSSTLPDFGSVDLLFAHLWLGKGSALQPNPQLLERFCRFYIALKPQRIIMTHLEEWGRGISDFWDLAHAKQVVAVFKELAPSTKIDSAFTGDAVVLG
jgi:hypothetical protein